MSVDKITQKSASSLLPGQTIWDQAVKGFGIRKQRRAAVYVFKYRQGGKQRFKTIGRHGSPWTADMARQAALKYLVDLLEGRGPSDKPDQANPTFSQFAKRYMVEHAAGRKKPRSLAEDRRNLDLHILPSLGTLRLKDITRQDVAAFHAAQHARPANANRCLALVSHIFTIAEKWGLRPSASNPCRGLDRYPERARERWLSSAEVRRLGTALDRYEAAGGDGGAAKVDWRVAACIRLLVLTGARLGEILGLEWSWINWDGGFARLPDSKTGAKTIPLPAPALAILEALQRRCHGASQRKLVFPGSRPDQHFQAIQKPWQQIRAAAGLADVRLHDLRHCYASFAVSGGESLYIVGAILGHRSTSTTQRYAHLGQDPVWKAASRTAGRLAELLGAMPASPARGSDRPQGGGPAFAAEFDRYLRSGGPGGSPEAGFREGPP